jgi:hypothetical protein
MRKTQFTRVEHKKEGKFYCEKYFLRKNSTGTREKQEERAEMGRKFVGLRKFI